MKDVQNDVNLCVSSEFYIVANDSHLFYSALEMLSFFLLAVRCIE